ncbi:MAG: LLM class flavin-dependent oxidoreductase [Candidatus Binatia bacterium]
MSTIKIGIGFGTARVEMPTPQQICAYAEHAEDLGIDSVWLSDRVVGAQLDIVAVMALFAARTKRIKMGPSVMTLPAHHPVHVARSYATLDYLSGGCRRVIMAVGIGNDPHECLAVGIPPDERGARMEEGVAVLRKLWSAPNVTHRGRYYQFEDVTIEPRPAHGPLDVWIGGRSDVALKRVARYGDGWFPSFVTPAEFRDGMQRMNAYAAGYGRAIDPREAGVLLPSYVTDDRGRADALLRQLSDTFKVPPDDMSLSAAIGPASACAAKLREFVEAGCTKFVLFPFCAANELVEQIEIYARDIMPRV